MNSLGVPRKICILLGFSMSQLIGIILVDLVCGLSIYPEAGQCMLRQASKPGRWT